MFAKELRCVSCNGMYPLTSMYECKECAGILEVTYDYEGIRNQSQNNHWNDYADFMPFPREHRVSLGEGNTPIIKSNKLAKRIGLEKLYFKCEFANPTGSFKDRPVSTAISKAVEFRFKQVIVASSGNGAAAVSAYAARAGLEAIVLVPESTPVEKVVQSSSHGAKVIKVSGPYSNCFRLAKEAGEKLYIFNLTSTFINPYTVEGDKGVAFEMVEQMNGDIPDLVYVPIGAGPLLVGIYKGYKEYQIISGENKIPRMAGIQAEGCKPIAAAYLAGETNVISEENPSTVAGGICDGLHGYSKDGTYTLNIIYQSKGFSNFVSDEEIREARHWLAIDEGLSVEFAAAAGVAGLYKSVKENKVSKDNTVVVILTGHGLKDISLASSHVNIPVISNQLEELYDLLD